MMASMVLSDDDLAVHTMRTMVLADVMRLRRVCRGLRVLVDRDERIRRRVCSRLATAPPAAVAPHQMLRASAGDPSRCIECMCDVGSVALCLVEATVPPQFALCDACRATGYRRMVNSHQVERVVRGLTWRPRRVCDLVRGSVRHIRRPQSKTNTHLFYAVHVVHALVRASSAAPRTVAQARSDAAVLARFRLGRPPPADPLPGAASG